MDTLPTIESLQLNAQEKPSPRAVDVHVGTRIHLRRRLLGMSQANLGEALGLTFQQVQKYESGANRVSASRLFDIARVLDVPIGFFFDDLPSTITIGQSEGLTLMRDADRDLMQRQEVHVLVRAYYSIADVTVRRRTLDLIKSLAADASRLELTAG